MRCAPAIVGWPTTYLELNREVLGIHWGRRSAWRCNSSGYTSECQMKRQIFFPDQLSLSPHFDRPVLRWVKSLVVYSLHGDA